MVTTDGVELYSKIPQKAGVEAVGKRLNERDSPKVKY